MTGETPHADEWNDRRPNPLPRHVRLTEAGVTSTRFDYCDVSETLGAETCLRTTKAAIVGAPEGKYVVLIGISPGGFWAAQCAREERVKRVVLVAPVLDPVARWTEMPGLREDGQKVLGDDNIVVDLLATQGVDNLVTSAVCIPSVYIMHSSADTRSPRALYHRRLVTGGVCWKDVGGTHSDVCGFKTGDVAWEFLMGALQQPLPLDARLLHK